MEILFESCLVIILFGIGCLLGGFALTLRCLELAWRVVPECVFVPQWYPQVLSPSEGNPSYGLEPLRGRNPYNGVGPLRGENLYNGVGFAFAFE